MVVHSDLCLADNSVVMMAVMREPLKAEKMVLNLVAYSAMNLVEN